MKMIVTTLLNVITVGAGVWAGTALRSPTEAHTAAALTVAEVSPVEAEKPEEKLAEDIYSLRFSRPFVVPVTQGWETQSLVVLNLAVEFEKESVDGVPALQNRVRDRVMAGLMAYSHEGGFSGAVTDPKAYDGVRTTVRDSLSPAFPDGVLDVQILEMVRRSL